MKFTINKERKIIKPICQQPFLAIANFVVSSRSRFARIFILAESTQFRSSQLTRSGGTLCATYFPNLRRKLLSYFFERLFLEIITEKFCVIFENRTELCR